MGFREMLIKSKNTCSYSYHYRCPKNHQHSGWFSVKLPRHLLPCQGDYIVPCGAKMEFTGLRLDSEVGARGEVLVDHRPTIKKLKELRYEQG